MDPETVVVFRFLSQCALWSIGELKTMESCVDFVRRRWPVAEIRRLKFEFNFGDLRNCLLDCDDDVRKILAVVSASEGVRLEIVAKYISEPSRIGSASDRLSVFDEGEGVGSNSGISKDRVLVPNFVDQSTRELLSCSWGQGIYEIGQCFEGGAKQLREILSKYAVELGFDFVYEHNTKNKVTAFCSLKKNTNCPWRIYATVEESSGYMYIRRLDNYHTCGYIPNFNCHKRLNSDIVSDVVVCELRFKKDITATDIVRLVKERVGHTITYRVAYKALEKARSIVHGDPSQSYNKLKPLLESIKNEDPESQVGLEFNDVGLIFKRCFVAFGACLHAFQFCRPVLFLDGTFLSNKFRGHLLCIVAKDGNQGKK